MTDARIDRLFINWGFGQHMEILPFEERVKRVANKSLRLYYCLEQSSSTTRNLNQTEAAIASTLEVDSFVGT